MEGNIKSDILDLTEIIGIMMGDGGLYFDKKKKYQLTVAFHKREKQYLHYVKKLFEKYFYPYKFCISELKNEFLLRNNSVFVGGSLIRWGLLAGNKSKNKLTIPLWILEERENIIRFIRGFFDTDGCVYKKYGSYAQIQFKLACEETVSSLRNALLRLQFNPTFIQKEIYKGKVSWKIYLSRQKEIKRFFYLVKPKNMKHTMRYNKIKK